MIDLLSSHAYSTFYGGLSGKMSEQAGVWLDRPFTPGTFHQSVEQFDRLMREITRRHDDVRHVTDHQRRQHIAGSDGSPVYTCERVHSRMR